MYRKLRTIRMAIAVTVLAVMTAGLCGAGGWLGALSDRLDALQIAGAAAGGALVWLLFWAIVTLLFGRVYCSTVCPAGTCLDIVCRIRARRIKGPLTQFGVARGYPNLRLLVLLVYIEAVALGASAVTNWLDPVADFGRLFSVWGTVSLSGIAGAMIVLVAGVATAWRDGRLLCNSICPAGAALGGISSVALMGFDINPDLCTHCGTCERGCKSRCINSDRCLIDNSRCVACFDCAASCPNNAIRWTANRHRLQWPLLMRTGTDTGVKTSDAAQCFDKNSKTQ